MAPAQERRKSARLNKTTQDQETAGQKSPIPHDSGTESDEEELQSIAARGYGRCEGRVWSPNLLFCSFVSTVALRLRDTKTYRISMESV